MAPLPPPSGTGPMAPPASRSKTKAVPPSSVRSPRAMNAAEDYVSLPLWPLHGGSKVAPPVAPSGPNLLRRSGEHPLIRPDPDRPPCEVPGQGLPPRLFTYRWIVPHGRRPSCCGRPGGSTPTSCAADRYLIGEDDLTLHRCTREERRDRCRDTTADARDHHAR